MSLLGAVVLFFVLAVILAILGFGVLAASAAGIAKILFYIFIFFFILSLIVHLARRV